MATKNRHRVLVGDRIRAIRERKKMSQERLAERADLHHNYVGEVERGEKAVSIDALLKLAKGLGVRVRDLVRDV